MPGPEYFKAKRAARNNTNDRFPPGSPARGGFDEDDDIDIETTVEAPRQGKRQAPRGNGYRTPTRDGGAVHPLAAARAAQDAAAANPPAAGAKPAKGPKKPKPAKGEKAEPRGPQLDGTGKPYITLAQLFKAQALTGTGAEAKHLIRNGGITVNGEAEARPGRKLHDGDVVVINGDEFTVAVAAG